MTTPAWIDLDGAVNARDLAGLPTADGRSVAPHRMLRSDSLQLLTDADVRLLVDDYDVRTVADLRTGIEVRSEGPGPLTREPAVSVTHLSLYPEPDPVDSLPGDGPVLLPWQSGSAEGSGDGTSLDGRRRTVDGVYSRYLEQRPDSLLAALRMIAEPDGATVVHCAAGKDRTGVVVALALAEVGVTRDAIVDDYVATGERIHAIIDGLAARSTYRTDLGGAAVQVDYDRHTPRAATMYALLDHLEREHGGAGGWLRAQGWSDADATRLRDRLLG